MRSILTASTLPLEKLPQIKDPLCFEPYDAQSALTKLLETWQKADYPSRLLPQDLSVLEECTEHDVLFVKHEGVIQGYVTYRFVGSGTLQELAMDPDCLDISNYFSPDLRAIKPEDLPELPIFNSRRNYKQVAFISKIETLPNQFGYGTALVQAVREQTKADLLIVHAIDTPAEVFFEKNDFNYPDIYNGVTDPEKVMAWCRPRRKR